MLITPQKVIPHRTSGALPRLGQINFVNCLPVVVPMQQSEWQKNAQVFYANPAELNSAFEAQLLDIGAMSSFYFLQNGTLRLVEGLSISSEGAVASVMFYSKRRPADLHGCKIAVPNCSATSVNLLLTLLKENFSIVPELVFEDAPHINNPVIEGALVIGDQALRAETEWNEKFFRADLGEWWRIVTGLPMVFGVWAARAEWANVESEQFDSISKNLLGAVQTGLGSQFDAVVAEGCRRTGMCQERMVKYFTQDLNYAMTDRHMEALELYGSLCRKHGLI